MLKTRLNIGMWLLGGVVVLLAVLVWLPVTKLTAYKLFPLLGLIAFGLMWTHYIGGAIRRYLGLDDHALRRYNAITSYVVLLCIVAHPALLEVQLYLDGLGLPFQSIPAVYTALIERAAIFVGIASLICFLAFEMHRFFNERKWWKYVEWANIAAMVGILWHGFTLGGELRTPWFQLVWLVYGISFVSAVIYSEHHKRRYSHAAGRTT